MIASTDCGFGTFTGREWVIAPVVWMKLKSLREGADIASAAVGHEGGVIAPVSDTPDPSPFEASTLRRTPISDGLPAGFEIAGEDIGAHSRFRASTHSLTARSTPWQNARKILDQTKQPAPRC